MGKEKFKTSNIAVCLKAIKDYIETDLTAVGEEEKGQLKDRAQKAVDHLSTLFNPEVQDVYVDGCPSLVLPTID